MHIYKYKYKKINKIIYINYFTINKNLNYIFGWIVIFILIGITIIFKESIFSVYTQDEDVIAQIMYAFPFWILELAINMTQSMMGGTMRAMGYQTIATVTGVISYWIIMLP